MRPRLIHNKILAIDPGSREMGYAVLYDDELVLGGVKDLRAARPLDVLLKKTRDFVRDVCSRYQIETIVVEQTFFRNNKSVVGLIAQAEDLKLLAKKLGLGFAAYGPRTARLRVLGNGGASKKEVGEAICTLYPELRVVTTKNTTKKKDLWWHNLHDAVCVGRAYLHDAEITRATKRTAA